MDASLALVPVHGFPPFFSKAGGSLANSHRNAGRSDGNAEDVVKESAGSGPMYGAAGFEIVRAAKGMVIDTYI
jgi:hypothetical protein